jgi:hypothetical protein
MRKPWFSSRTFRLPLSTDLEFLSQEFKKDITDERGYSGDSKVGSGKDIFDCRGYASLLSYAGTLKLSHQEIGIKEEDDETYLDHRSVDIFLHGEPVSIAGVARLPANSRFALPF